MATIVLPNGNRAIQLESGDILDPAYATVANVARMGPAAYRAVVAWLDEERSRLAELQAQREAESKAFHRETSARLAANAARQRELDERPALMKDVR